jgi:hypothetical protein
METVQPENILNLAPAIDTLKSLSRKFRETGDHQYMMEILLIIDEIEIPMLIDMFDFNFTPEA